jgi:hypothetical protein
MVRNERAERGLERSKEIEEEIEEEIEGQAPVESSSVKIVKSANIERPLGGCGWQFE